MPVDPVEFRQALSRFASGVTIVTVVASDELHGMTASSFASVSLDPPRVLVCLDKSSHTRSLLERSGMFAVNILSADQEPISRAFAHAGPKPFEDLSYKRGSNGSPLLDGALAWIECTTAEVVDGGDHDIVIGDVTACSSADGDPLIYFARGYRSLGNE
ncbi:MAG TPA: flavin reductase family protein [Actinomycetota bacterium]|nr:flavin reductase family protein [Actinomycetota bacterium]